MTYLNSQQLAFILDITKEDARARMCNAWTKEKGISKNFDQSIKGVTRNKKNKIEDGYPQAMPIDVLSRQLNLPDLQMMVDDIVNNYLTRPGTKRYILFEYPEKKVKKAELEGKKRPYKIDMPPALKSLLPRESQEIIYKRWTENYPVCIS